MFSGDTNGSFLSLQPLPDMTVTDRGHFRLSQMFLLHFPGRERASVWVEFLRALSAAAINRSETWTADTHPECCSARSRNQFSSGPVCCKTLFLTPVWVNLGRIAPKTSTQFTHGPHDWISSSTSTTPPWGSWIKPEKGEEDAAYRLLAVKDAARVMPGSLLLRLVGESILPLLGELEWREKTLGWSSFWTETHTI